MRFVIPDETGVTNARVAKTNEQNQQEAET
jgi:hypothetical protein